MSDIEVVAIQGLDAAIIGSTVRNGVEVLAYDYDKAITVLMSSGYSAKYAEDFIAEVSEKDFEGAPAFVYLDNDNEFYVSSTPGGTTVH